MAKVARIYQAQFSGIEIEMVREESGTISYIPNLQQRKAIPKSILPQISPQFFTFRLERLPKSRFSDQDINDKVVLFQEEDHHIFMVML